MPSLSVCGQLERRERVAQTIEIPMAVPTPNVREHFRVRAKRVKLQRETTMLALQVLATMPRLPVQITLTRIASRELDDDNLAFAFKAIRDAIAEWLGVKDGPRDPVAWSYGQAKAAPKYQAARVRIEELGPQ